jgi:hypothetical protein
MIELSEKDVEKLKFVFKSISDGLACSFDKNKCLEYIDSVLNPKCAFCRKPITGGFVVVNQHKMHPECGNRYKRK